MNEIFQHIKKLLALEKSDAFDSAASIEERNRLWANIDECLLQPSTPSMLRDSESEPAQLFLTFVAHSLAPHSRTAVRVAVLNHLALLFSLVHSAEQRALVSRAFVSGELLAALLVCVTDDTAVSVPASKLLVRWLADPSDDVAVPVFARACAAVRRVTLADATLRMRAYDFAVTLFTHSEVGARRCAADAAAQTLLREFVATIERSDDVLLRMCAVELVVNLSVTSHGIAYCAEQGVYDTLLQVCANFKLPAAPLDGLVPERAIKTLGAVVATPVFQQQQPLGTTLTTALLKCAVQMLSLDAIDRNAPMLTEIIATLTKTIEAMKSDAVPMVEQCVLQRVLPQVTRVGERELCITSFVALRAFFANAPITDSLLDKFRLTDTRQTFLDYLLHAAFVQNEDGKTQLRAAMYSTLQTLCKRSESAYKHLFATKQWRDFLFDRETEVNLAQKETKYNFLKQMAQSKWFEQLQTDNQQQLKTFLSEGMLHKHNETPEVEYL